MGSQPAGSGSLTAGVANNPAIMRAAGHPSVSLWNPRIAAGHITSLRNIAPRSRSVEATVGRSFDRARSEAWANRARTDEVTALLSGAASQGRGRSRSRGSSTRLGGFAEPRSPGSVTTASTPQLLAGQNNARKSTLPSVSRASGTSSRVLSRQSAQWSSADLTTSSTTKLPALARIGFDAPAGVLRLTQGVSATNGYSGSSPTTVQRSGSRLSGHLARAGGSEFLAPRPVWSSPK